MLQTPQVLSFAVDKLSLVTVKIVCPSLDNTGIFILANCSYLAWNDPVTHVFPLLT